VLSAYYRSWPLLNVYLPPRFSLLDNFFLAVPRGRKYLFSLFAYPTKPPGHPVLPILSCLYPVLISGHTYLIRAYATDISDFLNSFFPLRLFVCRPLSPVQPSSFQDHPHSYKTCVPCLCCPRRLLPSLSLVSSSSLRLFHPFPLPV